MNYIEIDPHPALKEFVRCYWTIEDACAEGTAELITPDGSGELIVHYGDPYRRIDGQRPPAVQPTALLVGQITQPLQLISGQHVGAIGVRFQPAGAAALLGIPQQDLTDTFAALDDVWPAKVVRELVERAAEGRCLGERIRAIEFELLQLAALQSGRDPMMRAAVRWIERCAGATTVVALADHLSIGVRQLERRFRSCVGLSPKTFARILRFRAVQRFVRGEGPTDWAGVAAKFGFTDQSHLIRDFHAFAGATPGTWRDSAPGLDDCFIAK